MRFSGLQLWILVCLFALGQIAAAQTTKPAAPAKPNVIVFIADDMGYSDLGCYGGEIRNAQSGRAGERRPAVHSVL